jgi:hypothetical protein
MAPLSIEWGTLSITLDNPKFQKAYYTGREHYFDTCYEGIAQVNRMTVEQVMQLIAIPDGKSGYQLDAEEFPLEELLGFALGYMSGPWIPETVEEEQQREDRYVRSTSSKGGNEDARKRK